LLAAKRLHPSIYANKMTFSIATSKPPAWGLSMIKTTTPSWNFAPSPLFCRRRQFFRSKPVYTWSTRQNLSLAFLSASTNSSQRSQPDQCITHLLYRPAQACYHLQYLQQARARTQEPQMGPKQDFIPGTTFAEIDTAILARSTEKASLPTLNDVHWHLALQMAPDLCTFCQHPDLPPHHCHLLLLHSPFMVQPQRSPPFPHL
jgi:hypothetical protein